MREILRRSRGSGLIPAVDPKAASTFLRFPLFFPTHGAAELFLKEMRRHGVVVEKTGLSLFTPDAPREFVTADR